MPAIMRYHDGLTLATCPVFMQDSVRNMIFEVPLAGHILVCWFHLDTDLGRVCSRTLNIDYSARIRV